MAKLILLVTFACLAAGIVVMAVPADDFHPSGLSQETEESSVHETEGAEEHLRFRRVTCDLLSFKGLVGDSACAANCLSMGRSGGRCNNGVCQCRKTKIKDLWNKRFG